MNKYWVILFIMICPHILHAQDFSPVSIGLSSDYHPDLRLIKSHHPNSSAFALKLAYLERKYSHVEVGGNFRWGYHELVSFSYGFSFAYEIPVFQGLNVKPGFSLDKFKMEENLGEFFIGGYFDGNRHESVKFYAEVETGLSNSISFVVQTGYRFFRSQVEVVKEMATGTTPRGDEYTYPVMEEKQLYYGAGLNIGFGLKYHF
ncbi:MAG: hypothetical protein WD491_14570 [Balneolales bacterium]